MLNKIANKSDILQHSKKTRLNRMEDLQAKLCGERVSSLVLQKDLTATHYYNQLISCLYNHLCTYITPHKPLKTLCAVAQYYDEQFNELSFITPSGGIVPKRESMITYNSFLSVFFKLLEEIHLAPLIDKISITPNIRFQSPKRAELMKKRDYGTIQPHSDAWAGEDSTALTLHIPLSGDIENNFVGLKDEMSPWEEDFFEVRERFSDGSKYLIHFKDIDYLPKLGSLLIYDTGTLHYTQLNKSAGYRLSLDCVITTTHEIHCRRPHTKLRNSEKISIKSLKEFGTTKLLIFQNYISSNIEPTKHGQNFSKHNILNLE
ncbi:hypothetical protein N9V13_05550 [Betaproteobacteria bacterium]|nr:hypothetical protein [Betaproteobacteria bacterium]